jgi:hypothetical protein
MNLTRANERPLEARGDGNPLPGSVKDWQSDRLAAALVKMEQVFEQAFVEQLKTAPVPSDAVEALRATISDMKEAGAHDPKAAKELAEGAERFLSSYAVNQLLPQVARDGADTELVAGVLAQVANREFAENTFYGVSQDACSRDVRLETMCDRAHALVKAGFIGEKELEGVRVSLSDPDSAKARAAESFVGIARAAGIQMTEGETEVSSSVFVDDLSKLGLAKTAPTIYVDKTESAEFLKSDQAATAKVFSHELGHWLGRDKIPEVLAAGVESMKAAGGQEAAVAAAFFKPGDLSREKLDTLAHPGGGVAVQPIKSFVDEKGNVQSLSWTRTVKEMQGDLLSLAVEHVVSGKAAALASADTLISERQLRHLDVLQVATEQLKNGQDPRHVRFGDEHNTSAAVAHFAERIKAGDLDRVTTPQQLDKLMGESIARGLVAEYSAARGAELNIHHVENGRAVPGVPPGVDLKAVLAAEMNSGLSHVPGTPTFLLTEKPPAAAFNNAPGVALEVGKLDGSGPTQSFWLTTKAPGVAVPEISKGTQEIAGREIAGTMVALAKDVLAASQAKEHSTQAAPAPASSVDSTKLPQLSDAGQGAKPASAEAKAEAAQPAPAMSM